MFGYRIEANVFLGRELNLNQSPYLLLAELYTRRDNFEKAEEWLQVGLLQLPGNARLTAGLASVETSKDPLAALVSEHHP